MTNEINTNPQTIGATVAKKDVSTTHDNTLVRDDSYTVESAQTVKAQEHATPSGNSMPVASSSMPPSDAEMRELVHQMEDHVQNIARDLKFSIDDESGRTVVKVIDSETDEVVRQIPSEEILNLIQAMKEDSSLLVKAEA